MSLKLHRVNAWTGGRDWIEAGLYAEDEIAFLRGREKEGFRSDSEIKVWTNRLDDARSNADARGLIRCPATVLSLNKEGGYERVQCALAVLPGCPHTSSRACIHRNGGVSWDNEGAANREKEVLGIAVEKNSETPIFPAIKNKKKTKSQIVGDDQETEIYLRLKPHYAQINFTRTNAMGIDLQCLPDLDVQSKAHKSIGPKDISHFADSSEAILKMFIALSFTDKARTRAAKRGVTLFTMSEFRERYPLERP